MCASIVSFVLYNEFVLISINNKIDFVEIFFLISAFLLQVSFIKDNFIV